MSKSKLVISRKQHRTKHQVVKSNRLVELRYTITPDEHHLLSFAMAQMNPSDVNDDKKSYKINLQNLYDLQNTKQTFKDYKKQMRRALDKLSERWLYLEPENNPDYTNQDSLKIRWISSYFKTLRNEPNIITFRFTPEITTLLSTLTREYTYQKLKYVMLLRTHYSLRLYELACQYRVSGIKKMKIEQIRSFLNIENKYITYQDLKNRVIEPSMHLINIHTDLNISYMLQKTGNKFTHIIFNIAPKKSDIQLSNRPAEIDISSSTLYSSQ